MRRRLTLFAIPVALLIVGASVCLSQSPPPPQGESINRQVDDSPFEAHVHDTLDGKQHEWRLRFRRAYLNSTVGYKDTGLQYSLAMDASDREPYWYVMQRWSRLSPQQRSESPGSPLFLKLRRLRPDWPAQIEASVKGRLGEGCEMSPTATPDLLVLKAKNGSGVEPSLCRDTRSRNVRTLYVIAAPGLRPDLQFACDESRRPRGYKACRLDGYVHAGWSVDVDFLPEELMQWRRVLRHVHAFLADHTVSTTSRFPSTEVRSLIEGAR